MVFYVNEPQAWKVAVMAICRTHFCCPALVQETYRGEQNLIYSQNMAVKTINYIL